MEVTRVRMKKEEDKRGNKKGKMAGGEEHRGGEGGSWDSWDTGEGCRPWFLEEIITHGKEQLGNWVGKGHQTGAVFNSHDAHLVIMEKRIIIFPKILHENCR